MPCSISAIWSFGSNARARRASSSARSYCRAPRAIAMAEWRTPVESGSSASARCACCSAASHRPMCSRACATDM